MANDNDTLFEADFSDVQAWIGRQLDMEGYVALDINEISTYETDAGNTRVMFSCTVGVPAEVEGTTYRFGMNVPDGEGKNRGAWLGLLVSVGNDPEKLKRKLSPKKGNFLNKRAYAFVTPKVGDAYSQERFLTKAQFDAITKDGNYHLRAIGGAAPASGGASTASDPDLEIEDDELATAAPPVKAPKGKPAKTAPAKTAPAKAAMPPADDDDDDAGDPLDLI